MVTASDVARLALDLARASFDNVHDSISTLQTIVEDQASAWARSLCGAPAAGVVDEYIGLLRRTRGDLRTTTDRCFLMIAEALGEQPAHAG